MSRKKMIEFDREELWKKIKARKKDNPQLMYQRMADSCGVDISTVKKWFKNNKAPEDQYQTILLWSEGKIRAPKHKEKEVSEASFAKEVPELEEPVEKSADEKSIQILEEAVVTHAKISEALHKSEDHPTQMTIYDFPALESSFDEFKAALRKNKECTVLDYVHEVINITKDPTIPDKFKELALRAAVNVILGLKEDKPS